MLTQLRSQSNIASHYEKPRLNVTEVIEDLKIPVYVRLDALDDMQRSLESLRTYTASLEAHNKDLEAYTHMVAHDLKDPLAALIVTADLLTHIPDISRKELKEYLGQIKSTAYNMNGIISNLLLFTEVTQAEAPVESVDMASIVTKVLYRLNHLIQEKGAQIDLPKYWPDAIGYAPWIEEVWANYISNAIKHGGLPPLIELGASIQLDGMVRFWIQDNGPGIPPKSRSRLFTPFSQLGHVRNQGNGLGLSIVYRIVEKLRGQVGVESKLGQGTLFFFTLPAGSASQV